jgi:hypothetical protein
LKLKHNEEAKKRQAEMELMEKRQRAMMMMEEQPTFAQLYLYVDQVGKGGISFDREGNYVDALDDLQRDLQKTEDDKRSTSVKDVLENSPEDLNLPQRNLYICYKSFPSLEKLTSSVMWNQSTP